MRHTKIILVSAILFIFAISLSFFITLQILDSNKYNFNAKGINGNVSLNDLDGKYKIIYFGYTFCPDICPLTLEVLKEALEEIDAKDDFLVVFISLDPARDTAQSLQEYVEYFYPQSLGLWVSNDDLENIAKNYGIKYQNIAQEDSAINYSVAHSSVLFLFDKKGNFVDKITNLIKDDIKNAINKMQKSDA